ncbi:MAG TPA: ATP-binding protein, partial [Candidatus Eisenbacteria bacterium]|nr:ATP-binding protein [Candidatus Eisenbacteria bacterium]
VAEQTVLYTLTDQLQRAGSLEEIYDSALDAILIGIGCDRASILLLDEAGSMRFVGWRGLSEGYRKAVEGHSPWALDVSNPKPICIDDVALADLPPEVRPTVLEEGIGALAFIPLMGKGRLSGKFMVYYNAPHEFHEDELNLALIIGRQLGFGVERKRSEDSLRRERELLQTIIDRIPAMITVYDADARLLRLNPEFERVTGWTRPVAAGQSLMAACYPDPAYREEILKFMQSSADGWMDITMRTRDGRDVETSWANIRLSDGTQVGIGIDITERKRAEERLREADRRKDEFLATLAHELRNPLAPIRNAVQILKARKPVEGDWEWSRDVIDRQVEHMTRLLEDLLDVSRISRNKLELRKERVLLQTVLEVALETTRPLLVAAHHRFSAQIPEAPIWLEADPVRLAQVFANLLNNAAKYTEDGKAIELTATVSGHEVEVRIRDEGIGIAPDMLPRIFEIFSQAKPALERTQGGLGIGLSLSKALVEAHGGRIEAASHGQGGGSTFMVKLPLSASGSRDTGCQPTAVPEQHTQPRRILVLDDNPDSADSLSLLLDLRGNVVHTAYDGESALELAGRVHPDVILLDIGLPGLSGYEVCRLIRKEPWGQNMMLIALTGWGQDEDRRKAREAGFDHHMTKPVDFDALLALLAAHPRPSRVPV